MKVKAFLTRWALRSSFIFFWAFTIIAMLSITGRIDLSVNKTSNSLTILAWPSLLDGEYLQGFTQQTNAALNVVFYTSTEELYSKMVLTKGHGYDLVLIPDFMVDTFIREDLVKKIDKTKLLFVDNLRPELLGHYFDPRNEYSVPYFSSVYGLGIDKRHFSSPPEPSWSLIFDKAKVPPAGIGMSDVPREPAMIAAQYLYGDIQALNNPEKRAAATALLIEQKKWVVAYTSANDLLAAETAPVVVVASPDMWRLTREDENLAFLVPKEGGFMIIDSFVMPKTTQKEELIYAFLNYFYTQEVIAHHTKEYGLCAPIKNPLFDVEPAFCFLDNKPKNIAFFSNVVPDKIVNDMWVELMAA